VKFLGIVLCLVSTLIAADPLSDKWQKRVDTAEANRTASLKRADDARFAAVQRANKELDSALRRVMADAVKVKDYDSAALLKEKVAAAEKGRTQPLRDATCAENRRRASVVSGMSLAAGAWTYSRHARMASVLRCMKIVAREEPVASATNRK
jgi:hypothetical protein